MTPEAVDTQAIARWRLQSLGLTQSGDSSVAEVLARLSVVQGQDFLPALWSLSQRTKAGATYDDVRAAFDDGLILRTHMLRPTWHLVAPNDILWVLAATAARVHKLNAPYYRQQGVDEEAMQVVRRMLERLLPGRAMTRTEIGAELGRVGLHDPKGNRLSYLMMFAELEGWICSGPLSGKQQTYMLVAERAPGAVPLPRRDALVELARRYFETRAPATVRDLAGWASLTIAEAAGARAALGAGFEDVEVDGRVYVIRGGPRAAPEAAGVVLIQGLDEWVMSYSATRDLGLGGPWSNRAPETYFHTILSDGALLGHWRYDRDARGRPRAIQTSTYRPMTSDERDGLDAAVQRFAAFVGREVSWE